MGAAAADRSPSVQRSRDRSLQRAKQIVEAARRLVPVKGADFTTHELVKEAGIAVQTFYKYFASKDQVLLAVIEDMVAESAAALREQAEGLTDPVARLRFYVIGLVESAGAGGFSAPEARFVTTQHWRLQQQYPDELAAATRPVTALLLDALYAAAAEGSLKPVNPEYDAWLASQLIMSVFHHYAFAQSAVSRHRRRGRGTRLDVLFPGVGWPTERRRQDAPSSRELRKVMRAY